jgi:hypothetical protein
MATKEIRYAIKGTSDTEKVTKKAAADMGVMDQAFHKFTYKLKHVGNQIAKSLFHVIGPLAIAHTVFGKFESAIEEYKQKIKEAVDAGSKLTNQARDAGMSVEQYQRVAAATADMGLTMEDYVSANKNAKKAIIEARDSTSHYHEVLKRLGFSSKDLIAGNVTEAQVLSALSDAINSTTDETTQSAIAVKAFGAEGEKMLKVLREWVELNKKISEAKALTSPFAKILQTKAEKEEFEKKKENVAIQRREATLAYVNGEAGTTDPAVKAEFDRLMAERRKALGPQGGSVYISPSEIASDPKLQALVESVVGGKMKTEAEAKKVTAPAAVAAAKALQEMPAKVEAVPKAETFKHDAGFSNVIGVGANPVTEMMNAQLEEQKKHTLLLQYIAAGKPGTFLDFTKVPEATPSWYLKDQ